MAGDLSAVYWFGYLGNDGLIGKSGLDFIPLIIIMIIKILIEKFK
jgi:hypothetical protein